MESLEIGFGNKVHNVSRVKFPNHFNVTLALVKVKQFDVLLHTPMWSDVEAASVLSE